MGQPRPYKVKYHYDGTKQSPDAGSDAYVIDTTKPIDGRAAFAELTAAEKLATTVSRNGGTATVLYRDSNGQETVARVYQPYEVAMAELTSESALVPVQGVSVRGSCEWCGYGLPRCLCDPTTEP